MRSITALIYKIPSSSSLRLATASNLSAFRRNYKMSASECKVIKTEPLVLHPAAIPAAILTVTSQNPRLAGPNS